MDYLLSLGDPAADQMIAVAYHQLGINAQERGDFDGAEAQYRKALEIFERLGLERDAASVYHQLGMVAQNRQDFDGAEAWYRKALDIKERLGHPPLQVNTLAQLGVLRRRQQQLGEAVSLFGRALFIAAEYQMRVGNQITADLARVMDAMGEAEFTTAWRGAFSGQEPPLEVLRQVLERLKEGT